MVYRSFIVIIYPTHAIFLTHDFFLFFVHRLLPQSQQSSETIERYVAGLQWSLLLAYKFIFRTIFSISTQKYFFKHVSVYFQFYVVFIFTNNFGPKRPKGSEMSLSLSREINGVSPASLPHSLYLTQAGHWKFISWDMNFISDQSRVHSLPTFSFIFSVSEYLKV